MTTLKKVVSFLPSLESFLLLLLYLKLCS